MRSKMNSTDHASHYPYHQYHQHQYHHHYQQRHHSHHALPSLAAAAAGSFPFNFDVDSLPTGSRAVDPAAGTGSRLFATSPLSTTGTTTEFCYFDEGVRRYASNGVVPPSTATSSAYLSFRSSSTRRPNVDARFASAPLPAPEMTSHPASPADCSGGLLTEVKGTRPTPASDAKDNGLQSKCAVTKCNISNPVTSSVRGCSDDVYALQSDDVPRHHKRLSTDDDNNDDVIKNANKIDAAASPSRDRSRHSDRQKEIESVELKHEVSNPGWPS